MCRSGYGPCSVVGFGNRGIESSDPKCHLLRSSEDRRLINYFLLTKQFSGSILFERRTSEASYEGDLRLSRQQNMYRGLLGCNVVVNVLEKIISIFSVDILQYEAVSSGKWSPTLRRNT